MLFYAVNDHCLCQAQPTLWGNFISFVEHTTRDSQFFSQIAVADTASKICVYGQLEWLYSLPQFMHLTLYFSYIKRNPQNPQIVPIIVKTL